MDALLLAAGFGTRLLELTESWPKCLMPIKGTPLLEYWIANIRQSPIERIFINTHAHAKVVEEFLRRPAFEKFINILHEPSLLGTAGTISRLNDEGIQFPLVVIHADNWCDMPVSKLLDYHVNQKPSNCLISMMTFISESPHSCGIVEVDHQGVVQAIHEKVKRPPTKLANGAVYVFDAEVVEYIVQYGLDDISTQVLPNFIGRIATISNTGVHRDIGSKIQLFRAQHDKFSIQPNFSIDPWSKEFASHKIHKQIRDLHGL